MKLAMLIGLCALVAWTCGCGSGGADEEATVLQVDEEHLGEVVTLAVGELMDLALPENPSTGYSWRCWWEPVAGLQLHEDAYVADLPVIPGSGGTRHLQLRAVQAGQVTVTIQYGRWWEGGEREEPRTLVVQVTD